MFNHVLHIFNALPHHGQDKSPLQQVYKRKNNFKNLNTVGCQIHVQSPGVSNKHFHQDACQGIFLGYVPHTDKLFVWYDKNSERIKLLPMLSLMKGLMIFLLIIYLPIINIFYS